MDDRVRQLMIFTEKGKPGITREEICLRKGVGIEGDRYADGGVRQISLLDVESRSFITDSETPGLCFRRFKENILVDGEILRRVKVGDILRAGEAEIRISDTSKKCFPECQILHDAKNCPLRRGSAWAEAYSDGVIRAGDTILLKE